MCKISCFKDSFDGLMVNSVHVSSHQKPDRWSVFEFQDKNNVAVVPVRLLDRLSLFHALVRVRICQLATMSDTGGTWRVSENNGAALESLRDHNTPIENPHPFVARRWPWIAGWC